MEIETKVIKEVITAYNNGCRAIAQQVKLATDMGQLNVPCDVILAELDKVFTTVNKAYELLGK